MKDTSLTKTIVVLIVLWIIAIVMYFLDILGPKGNSYIWIVMMIGATIGVYLRIRWKNQKVKSD